MPCLISGLQLGSTAKNLTGYELCNRAIQERANANAVNTTWFVLLKIVRALKQSPRAVD